MDLFITMDTEAYDRLSLSISAPEICPSSFEDAAHASVGSYRGDNWTESMSQGAKGSAKKTTDGS